MSAPSGYMVPPKSSLELGFAKLQQPFGFVWPDAWPLARCYGRWPSTEGLRPKQLSEGRGLFLNNQTNKQTIQNKTNKQQITITLYDGQKALFLPNKTITCKDWFINSSIIISLLTCFSMVLVLVSQFLTQLTKFSVRIPLSTKTYYVCCLG